MMTRSKAQKCLMVLSSISTLLMVACTNRTGTALDWNNTPPTQAATIITTIVATRTPPPQPLISPAPLPTPTPLPISQLPRDENGRIIGGAQFPVINYAPTMITGKPCPRVLKWEIEIVKMAPPLRDYGVSKDPCVVQNAVDDLSRTLWFSPAFNTPESMIEVDKVYDRDSMNLLGVERTLRESMIALYRSGEQNYNRCATPIVRLLNVDARAPFIADNDGKVSGQVIQLMILRAAPGGLPFSCEFVSYKDGSVKGHFSITSDADAKATIYNLHWDAKTRHWVVYFTDAILVKNFAKILDHLIQ